MNDSIVFTEKVTGSFIPPVESTKGEIVPANVKLWDFRKIPDICSWPTADEAKWKAFSSADNGVYYIPIACLFHRIGKRKQGLQPSEIKALRFAPIPSFAIAPEGTSA